MVHTVDTHWIPRSCECGILGHEIAVERFNFHQPLMKILKSQLATQLTMYYYYSADFGQFFEMLQHIMFATQSCCTT